MKKLLALLRKLGKTQVVILIVFLVGGLFGTMDYFEFSQVYEKKLLDLRFKERVARLPSQQDKVVIVAIDDQSLNEMKVRWPWPRSLFAKAIRNLSRAGARVVAFDLIFSEPSKQELAHEDEVLGRAILDSKAWIILASKFYTKQSDKGIETSYIAALPNIDPGRAHVGYVNIWPDVDGITRHAALLRTYQGKLYQSFALKILARYYDVKDPRVELTEDQVTYGPMKIDVESNARLLINFRGGPGHFQMISFENLMDDEVFSGLLESGVFKDKIVLIGPSFMEAQDNHSTPYLSDRGSTQGGKNFEEGLTPGVEIHANVLDTIMSGSYYHSLSEGTRLLLFFLLPLIMVLATIRLKPLLGAGVMFGLIALYGICAIGVFLSFRLVIPIFNPVLAMFFTYLGVMLYLLMTEVRQSLFIKTVFSRYVSPKVVEELVKDPNAELMLGGKKQKVTVLFSDIRGFTTLSEQLAPEAVVELLNEYFQTWTDIIFKHDGMVDKFIGDAVMAVFGAPMAHPDDAIRAVCAAWDMKSALLALQEKWRQEGKRTFEIGVGINTGEAIVGNMGSKQAMGYTVIGDTVNLASRLESATKELKAFLLISESTYQEVKARAQVKLFKDITVKGKARNIEVYAVEDWQG